MDFPVILEASATATIPTGFYSQRFWGLSSLSWNSGLCSLSLSQLFFHVYLHMNVVLPSLPAPSCCMSSLSWLPISAPSTSVDEYFFFNSLIVRFPYSFILWQFWLFLNWWLSFFWLCKEEKCIYLHLHLGRNNREWKNLLLLCAIFLILNLLLYASVSLPMFLPLSELFKKISVTCLYSCNRSIVKQMANKSLRPPWYSYPLNNRL